MNSRRLLALVSAAAVLSAGLPALAGSAPARIDLVSADALYGDLGSGRGDARTVAASALRTYGRRLGVDAARFRLDTVRRSPAGTHVRGTEVRDGVKVDGTYALVSVVDGRVWQVAARDSDLAGRPVAAPVPAAVAVASAMRHAKVTTTVVPSRAERLLVAKDGRLADVYRVGVLSLKPAVALTYDVSAADGRVLAVRDDNRYVDGHGTAFDPNPVVTGRNNKMRQPGVDNVVDTDLDSAELTAQLRTLPLKGLDATALASGRLVGPWATIHANVGPSLDGKFAFTRGDPRFEATMAYAHIDAIQRYFQSLGFLPQRENGANAESQDIVAMHVEGFDNSFYQPANDIILFGAGGVDDGEDAEVIVHEYGHAVHDDQVPGWGNTNEGGSMGEGFGDFLAAAYYARKSGGYGDVCVADWDATTYNANGNPPCLRRMDSKKKYPDDMEGEVHADGELWSALLWRLRQSLGRNTVQRSDNSIRLVLTSHEFLTPDAEFGDAVAALRLAARALKQPGWTRYIDAAARAGKMPLNP